MKSPMKPTASPKPQTAPNKPLDEEAIRRYRLEKERERHEALTEENVHVGFMFGSKALVQLIANPLIGPLTNK